MPGSTRKLILNADDFGLSPGVNRGIRESVEAGVIPSVSAMANFPCVSELIAFHRDFPAVTIGGHLNPIVGRPVLPCREVPTLVDPDGRFWNREFSARLRRGLIDMQELEDELSAQVRVLRDLGIALSHLDSHQNEHLRPGYFGVFLRIAGKFGIRKMRNHRHFICAECDRPAASARRFYAAHPYSLLRHRYTRYLMWRARSKGMLMADRLIFAGHSTGASQQEEWVWEALLKNMPDGISELYCHPGYSDDWLREHERYADQRERELRLLCSPSFKELLSANRVELVGFDRVT
jgi:predicted glycoside hydrolase/deacetylase ChbG (UPF0249 family)